MVGLDGEADLRANALVGTEQRQVAVGGAAGHDADETCVVEVTEALDEAAAEIIEVGERNLEESAPELGEFGVVGLAGLAEEGFVFLRGDDLALQILRELGEEDGMRELFEQDRGEIEVAMEADAVAFEVA